MSLGTTHLRLRSSFRAFFVGVAKRPCSLPCMKTLCGSLEKWPTRPKTNPGGEMLPFQTRGPLSPNIPFFCPQAKSTSSSLASTCCSSHLVEHDAGHSRGRFLGQGNPKENPGFFWVTIGFGVARTVHKLENYMLHQVFFWISAQRSAKMVAFSIVAQLENEEIICNSNSVTLITE